MKMTNEERQALIAECNRGIKNTNRWLRANKDIGNPENAAKKQLQIYEIALAALTAEPATQPESEDYRNLKEIYHAQEKRLFKLAQSIKGQAFDKYSHTTSQAIDVLESALTAESVKVPEGYKLVPIEPTKEMRLQIHPIAEACCMVCRNDVTVDCEENVLLSWADMLNAEPDDTDAKRRAFIDSLADDTAPTMKP